MDFEHGETPEGRGPWKVRVYPSLSARYQKAPLFVGPFGIRRTGKGEPGRAKRDLVRHKIVRNNFEHLAKRRWPLRGGGQDARSKFVGNKFELICAKRSEPKGQGAWMHPVIPTDSLLDLMSLRDMFNCEYSDSQRPSPPNDKPAFWYPTNREGRTRSRKARLGSTQNCQEQF